MKICAIILAVLSFFGLCNSVSALEVGDPAPRVASRDQDNNEVDLATLYAKGPTLVYFYPKADTPGCTAQACSLRDAFPDFTKLNVQVVGVSGDSVEAQKKFARKNKLPFVLLADTDSSVAKAFGVPLMPLLGVPQRQSFIVKNGKIVWIVRSAKTGDHAGEVKSALKELGLAE